jgi:hypothetical protein
VSEATQVPPRDTPEEHLARVLTFVSDRLPPKYRAGQAEHGGVLSEKVVLPHAIEEALDLLTYLATLEEQHVALQAILAMAMQEQNWRLVGKAFALLARGCAREEA